MPSRDNTVRWIPVFALLTVTTVMVPRPLSAQSTDCADCRWNKAWGAVQCLYSSQGDVFNCTQCTQYACCGQLDVCPLEIASAPDMSADGSVQPLLSAPEELANSGGVLRRSCDGAIVARRISEPRRTSIRQQTAELVL